jgi:LmbE family N-acetylglucosaminyl deacetylase
LRGKLRSLVWLALLGWAQPLAGQLQPPSAGGIVELDRLLQRLAEPRRILMIGAHPDDEDTEILALAALGYGAEAAYLSLSRGEGGQNLIGPELGEALGLLRSQELLAARGVDGARQFFTRAYDFGFSRSLEEALRFWPLDSLLKDAVRVVRKFRPHVIVSVFTGTPRDGHGQHQAAGVVAQRVFDLAGDPAAFPELASEEGLTPFTPLRLYRSTRFDPQATTIELETGALERRTGRSFHQIAMASRSLHRSQDMGQLQRLGPRTARLQLMKDRSPSAGDGAPSPFAGIPAETSWITRLADSLRSVLNPARPELIAQPLADALARLEREPGAGDTRSRALLEQALAIASGLAIDARADDYELVPGERTAVSVEVFNAGPFPAVVEEVELAIPRGWRVEGPVDRRDSLPPGRLVEREFSLTVARDAPYTQPYFLVRPRVGEGGGMYDWSGAPPSVRGLPFDPPVAVALVKIRVLGAALRLEREVTYRANDQALGEVRQALRVVPPVEVRLQPSVLVWPSGGSRTRSFTVTVTSRLATAARGEVRLELGRWPAPAPQRFSLERAGESAALAFTVELPPNLSSGAVTARAVARLEDGRESSAAVALVDYPHVRPTPYVLPATAEIRVAPIALPAVSRVGYVRGASDLVPEALAQLGLPLEILGAEQLARSDLSVYDAIVIGARAYETDSALVRHNRRLLDYVRGGGLLLVQYQQYAFVTGNYAPYPLTINRPHDRVTDENAPVTILEPAHPAFTRPNRIGPEDWQGWPQERGLYFAGTWDQAYRPLIETADPGYPPLRGGLLLASYGRGTYVYTGLAFFRALPAGVPGAYRLFLNLLALGAR